MPSDAVWQQPVEHAHDVPVAVGIGAMRTSQVLQLAEDAQTAGASGVLLAPVSYQPLTEDDVYGLYADVTAQLSVPLIVYDNPTTTHFTFTDDLYAGIGALPHVASIKIPGVIADEAQTRVDQIRALVPSHLTIGVSGDVFAASGLAAGCDTWYSVIGGILPEPALAIARAALSGDQNGSQAHSQRLQPLWDLFGEQGSLA